MPDLDDQLRHCLQQHAEGVTAAPGLSAAARVRSQRMGRASHALTALAVVPVTAGAVAGGVALASPAHHSQQARVTAANTPSAKPSATAAPKTISYGECPKGTSPKLKALDGTLTGYARHQGALQNIHNRQVHLKDDGGALPKAIYSMHVIAHRSNGRAVIAFERAPLDGKTTWTIAVRKSPTDFVSHRAKLLGCVPKK